MTLFGAESRNTYDLQQSNQTKPNARGQTEGARSAVSTTTDLVFHVSAHLGMLPRHCCELLSFNIREERGLETTLYFAAAVRSATMDLSGRPLGEHAIPPKHQQSLKHPTYNNRFDATPRNQLARKGVVVVSCGITAPSCRRPKRLLLCARHTHTAVTGQLRIASYLELSPNLRTSPSPSLVAVLDAILHPFTYVPCVEPRSAANTSPSPLCTKAACRLEML